MYKTWILINGLFVISIYFGVFKNNPTAENITLIFAWFTSIIGIISLSLDLNKINPDKLALPTATKNRIDILFDIIVTIIFINQSWFFTGIIYGIHIYTTQLFYKRIAIYLIFKPKS